MTAAGIDSSFRQHISTAPLREVRVIGDWHRRMQTETRP
jgi:hypothetical protein